MRCCRSSAIQSEATTSPRHQFGLLGLAVGAVVAWWGLLAVFNPGVIVDERTHLFVIGQLACGEAPRADLLPMLPAMHWMHAGLMRVTGVSLLAGRTLSAAMSIAAILCIYAAARRLYPRAAGAAALLFILNPVYLPYCALVYTEPPAMLALAAAVWFFARGSNLLAAVALAAACVFRQSNVVWAVFFIAWAAAERNGEQGRSDRGAEGPREKRGSLAWSLGPLTRLLRRLVSVLPARWPYLLPPALFVVAAVAGPQWVLTPTEDNRAGFNIAQFFLFGLVSAAAFAPLWVSRLVREWPATIGPALARATVCTLLVTAVGLLESIYDNPHHWNASTNYIHDRTLVLLQTSMAARYAASALLVAAGAMLARYVWQAARRGPLLVAWSFSLLFLSPHRLVDHRYYIVPIMMINMAAGYQRGERAVLCTWFAVLAAVTAGYTLLYGGIDSGL
jgi:hypothetical protein